MKKVAFRNFASLLRKSTNAQIIFSDRYFNIMEAPFITGPGFAFARFQTYLDTKGKS